MPSENLVRAIDDKRLMSMGNLLQQPNALDGELAGHALNPPFADVAATFNAGCAYDSVIR
ncbi:hypothetical protein BAUCODRAFT_28991 [Baudoinia panamericana UAMH 10762]|uniref:Uncharacterized protein n=1 Tax=Baudoinia panamericana (strain UAMH 10762) TaxID=717646 RepID=M2M0V7_BAUPA|nr:uncharacterized protein BAUCODRAFT_28991 [Baudoinia panamericana UAMH 10762]EMD00648.1 hypothetical protein BAUCODRAFT_28991 [Baudoinia panamericana UAMH 10762]